VSPVEQRVPTGLLLATLMAMACASVMLASFQYVVVDMQTVFGFSSDSANALTFMPLAASLLVVFIAGSLADRLGARRLLLASIGLVIGGAVLVGLARGIGWLIAGRVLDGVGGVTMSIVALSMVNAAVSEAGQRARVFALYAAVTPAAFMVAPPLAAFIVQSAGWRAGTLPVIVMGLLALLTTWRFVPHRARMPSGELLTPLLAGIALAGLALAVTTFPVSTALSSTTAIVGILALLALIPVMRRIPVPTLDLRWWRQPGMLLLTIAVGLTAMPNLFFYTNLLLQYRYTVPVTVIALLLMVPQAIAAAGSLLSGPVSARIGPLPTAFAALLVTALAGLGTLMVTGSAPIWVPVLALTLSAGPAALVVGPMTNALLSRAPADASGAASSMRKATWTLGNVLGGALIGALAFRAFEGRLADLLGSTELTSVQARTIAREIRDGAVVDDLAARISEPIARASLIDRGPGLVDAQAYAYSVMGLTSAALYLAAAIVLMVYARRIGTRFSLRPRG